MDKIFSGCVVVAYSNAKYSPVRSGTYLSFTTSLSASPAVDAILTTKFVKVVSVVIVIQYIETPLIAQPGH